MTVNFPPSWDVGTLSDWNGSYYGSRVQVPEAVGFIEWTPSAGPVIYVSDSIGNDSFDGLSGTVDGGNVGPKKTINAGMVAMTAGSHLLMKTGDTFTGQIFEQTDIKTGTATNYTLFGFYGDVSLGRPKITIDSSVGFAYIIFLDANNQVEYVWWDGIDFDNYRLDIDSPNYNPASPANPDNIVMRGGQKHIVMQDNYFNHISTVFELFGAGATRQDDFTFNRNVWTGAYSHDSTDTFAIRPSNMYISHADNFTFRENVVDMGGWSRDFPTAGASQYNHNMYLADENSDTFVLERNIITRASSHGVHGRAGGDFLNNFYGRNAISQGLGYGANYPESAIQPDEHGYVIDAVISEGASMFKGATQTDIDQALDGAREMKTAAIYGLFVGGNDAITGADIQFTNSIVALLDTEWAIDSPALSSINSNGFAVETGNIAYHWLTPTEGDGPNYTDPNRTLATYQQKLVTDGAWGNLVSSGYVDQTPAGYDVFDTFMEAVKNRKLRQWDDSLSAGAVNNYIREGFDKPAVPF